MNQGNYFVLLQTGYAKKRPCTKSVFLLEEPVFGLNTKCSHAAFGGMAVSGDNRVLRAKLNEICGLCEGHGDLIHIHGAKRAHKILRKVKEVSTLLDVNLTCPDFSPGSRIPEDYWPFVYSCAHRVLSHLDQQTTDVEVAKELSQICLAMEKVRDFFLEQASASDTTASSECSMKITINHFLQGGGIHSLSEQFHHVPSYSQLHDLGVKLLHDNHLVVCEFDLLWDETKLQNNSTLRTLREFLQSDHGPLNGPQVSMTPTIPEGCIFLKLRGGSLPPRVPQSVPPEKFLICIDGNIGSFKSQFMKWLSNINEKRDQTNVDVIREPLEATTQERTAFYAALAAGENVSEGQLAESSRFEERMFEHHFGVATRIREKHIISERSMDAKVYVFNELNCEQGRLLADSRDQMKGKFQKHVQGKRRCEPHAIIFFNISVKRSLQRIKERKRPEEENITEEYLTDIEKKYSDLYRPDQAPHVIRIESDHPMEEVLHEIQAKLPKVLKDRSTASEADIASFMEFFQGVRSEKEH